MLISSFSMSILLYHDKYIDITFLYTLSSIFSCQMKLLEIINYICFISFLSAPDDIFQALRNYYIYQCISFRMKAWGISRKLHILDIDGDEIYRWSVNIYPVKASACSKIRKQSWFGRRRKLFIIFNVLMAFSLSFHLLFSC